jgi:hypothetical protein
MDKAQALEHLSVREPDSGLVHVVVDKQLPLRRFLEKILPYGTRPDYTFAFLTSNPFVRYSGVRACSTPAMSSVPHARTENRYTLSGLENDWSHTALL